jgi:hypothetical protein
MAIPTSPFVGGVLRGFMVLPPFFASTPASGAAITFALSPSGPLSVFSLFISLDLIDMAAKLKFPDPKDYPEKDPLVFCPNERMIGLYNQATGSSAVKMAKKLNAWFVDAAIQAGWAGCRTLPTVQSKHGAGCVLLNPRRTTRQKTTLTIQFDQDIPD